MWDVFSSPHPSSPAMAPPSLMYNGCRGTSAGVKWPGCGVDHSAANSAATEHMQSYTSTPPLCLHCMLQKDLYLSPLGGPIHRYTNGYSLLEDMTLSKPTGIHMLITIHQSTVCYKPDLVKHFKLTLVNFPAPVH